MASLGGSSDNMENDGNQKAPQQTEGQNVLCKVEGVVTDSERQR